MFKKILSVMIFCCSLIQSYASNTLTDIHDFNGNPLDGSGPQLNTSYFAGEQWHSLWNDAIWRYYQSGDDILI